MQDARLQLTLRPWGSELATWVTDRSEELAEQVRFCLPLSVEAAVAAAVQAAATTVALRSEFSTTLSMAVTLREERHQRFRPARRTRSSSERRRDGLLEAEAFQGEDGADISGAIRGHP